MSAPDQKSMKTCVKDLKRNNVKILVKSCETEYTADILVREGIQLEELIFEDGRLPSQDVINRWLKIVDDFFDPVDAQASQSSPPQLPAG